MMEKKIDVVPSFLDANELIEKKVGLIAKGEVSKILESNKATMEEILWLQSDKYSKETFNLQYPLLKEINYSRNVGEQKKDQYGRNRYYKDPITIYGKKYFLCSQWYEKNRSYLIKWIESRKS